MALIVRCFTDAIAAISLPPECPVSKMGSVAGLNLGGDADAAGILRRDLAHNGPGLDTGSVEFGQ